MPLPQAVRGTQSLIGEAADRFHHVVSTFDRVRRLYGFGRVEVPVFENTSVFARSLGEATDVVSKEMYTFDDKGGDSLTLRPEFTAGIARAYLSEGWQQYAPVKLATWGPAFRYERPQKGRFRQFHQLDAEIIGAGEPAADVEIIAFAAQLLDELGLGSGVHLLLNTLGDPQTRSAWRAALVEYFGDNASRLSEESRKRLLTNPLRILDSKDFHDWSVIDEAPSIDAYLSSEASEFFTALTSGLDAAGIRWTRQGSLVRGLDYYRHTAFEFVAEGVGTKGTVIGGGRYDGLIKTLGGPDTPAVGWAAGMERLAMLIGEPPASKPSVVVTHADEAGQLYAFEVSRSLRNADIPCDLFTSGRLKKQLEKASRRGFRVAVILGEGEALDKAATVLNFASGQQEIVKLGALAGKVRSELATQVHQPWKRSPFKP